MLFFKVLKLLFFLMFLIGINLEALDINKELFVDMSKTYGYSIGQSHTLKTIKKKFPHLALQVFVAQKEFDMSYKDSLENIDKLLSDKTNKAWAKIKSEMKQKVSQMLDPKSLTEKQSIDFINEVRLRAKGSIESPFIETLLMFHPSYQKSPEQELYNHFYQTYNSDGNPKAKGVNFSIQVPKSYKSAEANRPNIVRKFISSNGYSVESMIMVLVYNLPEKIDKLSKEDVEALCSGVPEGSVLRECDRITLENLPGIRQRFKSIQSRLDHNVTMETVQYMVFYNDKLISIQGQVGSMDDEFSEEKLLKQFSKFKPVFDYVANSLVIENLYLK